jgi:hypothetical protein
VNAREYHQAILQVIGDATFVLGTDISVSEIDVNVCYVRGTLFLPNDCELHIAEYVITFPSLHRPKYRYHLQKSDGSLLARWDNVPHYPRLDTYPDHHHDETGNAHPSPAMDIPSILEAIIPSFLAGTEHHS